MGKTVTYRVTVSAELVREIDAEIRAGNQLWLSAGDQDVSYRIDTIERNLDTAEKVEQLLMELTDFDPHLAGAFRLDLSTGSAKPDEYLARLLGDMVEHRKERARKGEDQQ